MAQSLMTTPFSGDLTYEERRLMIDEFMEHKSSILITTDLLDRTALNSKNVVVVCNCSQPVGQSYGLVNKKRYMLRSGRTGHFGKRGIVIDME